MNRIRDCTLMSLAAMLMFVGLTESRAQDQDKPTVLTINPAKQPVPALKYRLLPERHELVPGNAAIFYHRACLMITSKNARTEQKVSEWISGSAKDIPREEAKNHLEAFASILHEAELGAYREECNWEFDHREEGYNLLLQEVQELRSVGRLVILKARLEILDGHPDKAIHWIEVGLAMSRHVGDTSFIIPGLVGISISSQLLKTVEELTQLPGAPNLYWAFATRPRPLIDIQREIEGERYLLERELPALRELDGPAWSHEKARLFGDELFRKISGLMGDLRWISPATGQANTEPPRLKDLPSRLALTAMVARIYPEAKRALIAEGRTEAELEAMPAFQVVLIHTYRKYCIVRDDVFKWSALPYWQQPTDRMSKVWESYSAAASSMANPLLKMFTSLMPAVQSAHLAGERHERQLDALQYVEAIRMYAGDHDGALPENLDALTATPLPIDPLIGKPFEYKKVDATTAVLSAPNPPHAPNHPVYRIHYELKLTK